MELTGNNHGHGSDYNKPNDREQRFYADTDGISESQDCLNDWFGIKFNR